MKKQFKKVMLALMPFVVAGSVAVAGSVNFSGSSALVQPGYVGNNPTNCSPANIPDDCNTENDGAICTNQHLNSDCLDQLFLPQN